MTEAHPVQEQDLDSLDALLIAALDGADQTRIALLTQLYLLRQDPNREADLARLCETGIGPVTAL